MVNVHFRPLVHDDDYEGTIVLVVLDVVGNYLNYVKVNSNVLKARSNVIVRKVVH